jgi:hypothetical protein
MMIRPPSDLYAAISIAGALLYGGDFIARFAEEIGCEPTETAVRAWAPADFDEVQLIAIDEWIVRRLAERLDEIHDAKRRECSTGRKLVEVKAIATSAALVWTSSTIRHIRRILSPVGLCQHGSLFDARCHVRRPFSHQFGKGS